MQLPSDFRDLICALNDAGVEYLLIGGYAMGAYGRPRYTGDIDLFIRRTLENGERIVFALKELGYSSQEMTAESLAEPNVVHFFGRPPLRVDFLNTLKEVEFDEAWGRRVNVDIEGLILPVMCKQDLIVNKRAAGRLKDLADVESLESEDP
jgi:predicted nucleotidyltransferase